MRKINLGLLQLLAFIFMLLVTGATGAEAVLKDFGPPNFAGYPSWYRDTNNVAIQQCLSRSFSPISGLPICNLLPFPDTTPPFDPLLPATFPPNPPTNYNWPLESFYFSATPDPVTFTSTVGSIVVENALEATFGLANPIPGEQVVFTRFRAVLARVPSGNYTVTHPYGVEHLTVPNEGGGIGTLRFTRDIGATGIQFAGALNGDVGPWLRWTPSAGTNPDGTITIPATGEVFIGDFNVPHTFTGSPFGTNYFRVDGPVGSNIGGTGIDFLQTNLGMIEGQLYTAPIPSPLVVDRATYKRDALGAQVDIFATATPAANLTISAAGNPGIPSTAMTKDAVTGRFFKRYNSASPATLPSLVNVTNIADVPATVVDAPLVDEVTVTSAAFDVQTGTLTVVASSSDQLVPQVLSAIGFGPLTGTTLTSAGITVPPTDVTVVSTGGGKQTASVTIVDTNAPPIAVNDSATTNEGQAVIISVLANDTDPNPGDTVEPTSVQVVGAPANGTAVASVNGTITYTPNANFRNANDTFTYMVRDNHAAASNTATVTVTVNATNVPPTADAQSQTTAEDTLLNLTLTATDTDGTVASFSIASQPAHGTVAVVSAAAGTFTYTPALNYNGADSFTFTATDNLGGVSAPATVSLTVTAVNDAPVAVNDSTTANLNTARIISVLANDTDVDNALAPATATITSPATSGTAVANVDGTITYTPNNGFTGSDSFTYTVQDVAGATSNAANVSVSITNTNVAPVANGDSARLNRNGGPITINVVANDTDADGTINAASVAIVTDVTVQQGATTNNNNGTVSFTPALDFSGTATFTYTVQDSFSTPATSNIATVTITVNAPPTAANDAATTLEDTPVNISLLVNDTDAENNISPASVAIVASPANGTVTVNASGIAAYTPNANYNGQDSFTYNVKDTDNATSNTATVTVTVTAVNDLPTATAQVVPAVEDTPVAIILAGTDNDGTIASYAVTTSAATRGTLTGTAPTLTYTPGANLNGPASFTFTVTDNQGGVSAPATVTINVAAVNDAPVATAQAVSTNIGTPVNFTLAGSDVDGNTLTYAVATNPTKGTLSGTAPNLTYTPTAGQQGADSFTFTVNDGSLTSPAATVSIAINGETITPTRVQYTASVREWRIEGTSTIPGPGNIMTAKTEAAGNATIGSAQVDGTGLFVIRVRNSAVPFNATIRLDSNLGGSRTGVVVTPR